MVQYLFFIFNVTILNEILVHAYVFFSKGFESLSIFVGFSKRFMIWSINEPQKVTDSDTHFKMWSFGNLDLKTCIESLKQNCKYIKSTKEIF